MERKKEAEFNMLSIWGSSDV